MNAYIVSLRTYNPSDHQLIHLASKVMFKSSKDHPQFTDDHVDALVASVETAGGSSVPPLPAPPVLELIRVRYSIKHRYASKNMRGFAGTFSEEFKAALEKEDAVKYIGESALATETRSAAADDPQRAEPDGPVSIQA